MWLNGPIQWINIAGWRKLEPFEEHAMFILWRELSVLLGCKWVPSTYEDFEFFSNVGACLVLFEKVADQLSELCPNEARARSGQFLVFQLHHGRHLVRNPCSAEATW